MTETDIIVLKATCPFQATQFKIKLCYMVVVLF